MIYPELSKLFNVWLCSLAFVLGTYLSFGQSPRAAYGISPTTPLENCSFDQWTGDNGLLSNNLTSVIQASSGFLWITTNNGLMRFDGVRLEIFDQGVLPFLSTDAFYHVYEDKNKMLWFATRGNGIIKYDGKKFIQHLPDHPLVPKSLRAMLIQDDGTIWAGSDYKGLMSIRDTVVTKLPSPLLNNVSILALEQNKNGDLYIGTNSKGLMVYHGGEIKQIPISGSFNQSVNVIKSLENGTVLIGTTYGLFVLKDGRTEAVDFLRNIQVNDIITDHYGSIWIATERGLARMNEDHGVHEFLRSGKSFPGAHISSLFFDNEGSLWMSTGKSGLLRLKESAIRNYNEQHGLTVDRVNIIHEAPDGKFFICLDDGYVDVMDNGLIKPFPISSKAWNESVRDILVENDGTCWIASYNGVLKKSGQVEKLFTTNNGLSSNSVRRIFKDSRGSMWFGTRTGGVMEFRNDKVIRVLNRESGLSSDYILAIEEDKNGNLLIGTHSGGLNILSETENVDVYHIKEDDDGVLIFNIHVDQSGEIFLATSVGLFHFDRGAKDFTRIMLTDVVKGESYFDWVEDTRGNVWITTNIGILQISKEDVQKFLAGELESVRSKVFNDYDGMKNKECTGATRSLLSTKGEVWVPTIEGICVVNPDRQRENKIIPPVYVTEFITDDQMITNPDSAIVVPPGNFRITLQFTSLSLLAPNKVRFKYRLSRINKEWQDTQYNDRSVDYTNLPPGEYTFYVKASNNDGIWNEDGAKVTFRIRPYFYQTAWFYVLIALALLLIFYLIYRLRVTAVEHKNTELLKVNSELDRFVYSASHDLRAPLASILGLVKLTRLDQDPTNRGQYLEMIEKSILKLDGFIHDIINYSRNARTEVKPELINFEVIINEILEALRFQEKSSKIRKQIEVKGSGDFYTDIKRLDIVLFNLITNAIKYHKVEQDDPYLIIKVTYDESHATISVIDNGIGIDQQHLDNIFKMFYRADERSTGSGLGLFIAKETIEKISGKLSVQSQVGKGSTFTIEIPSLKKA